MTFEAIEAIVRRRIGQGANFDVIGMLREAENDFCRRTYCKETIDSVLTSTLNSGTLSPTYSLPSGFLREFRLEWDGVKLEKAHIKGGSFIYDSDGSVVTGTPSAYWLENNLIRLVPQPSSHGYLNRWYAAENIVTDGDSPVIPSIEHRKLVNYVVAEWHEINSDFKLADRYRAQYLQDCSDAYFFYRSRRGKQKRIVEPGYSNGTNPFGVGSNIVQESTLTPALGNGSLARSTGTPATGDPKDLFNAGTDIVHTFEFTARLTLPVVVPIPKSDWPVFVKSVALSDGIATVTVGIGAGGSATEDDFDYDLQIF